jgi:hypothetical protein
MRSLWILPDRAQSGDLLIQEGDEVKRLTEVIQLATLPPSLTLGIPEEILRRNAYEDFVYAQYVKLEDSSSIFCVSLNCGTDRTQRTVTLTNLQILEFGESPVYPPPLIEHDDPLVMNSLNKLRIPFAAQGNVAATKVQVMLAAVENERWNKSFGSERLVTTTNKPDWMPQREGTDSRVFFSPY